MTSTLPQLEDATWHRLHPRMLLVHPIVEVGRALPALAGIFLAGHSGGHDYWTLAAAAVIAVLSLTRWFTTRLRITAESVQLQHGLVRRRTINTARDRIRTVDVTAHPLHRVLGLARVVIGTGTNDRKGEGRMVLDGLTRAAATELRGQLLHRAPPTARSISRPEDVEELARLDRRWIRYAPFTLSGVVTGLVLWGLFWRTQGESGVNLTRSGPLRALGDWLRGLPTAGAVLLIIAAVVVFVALTSTAGYVLAFWNFRLTRHAGGTLQVTRGLLTTRATSIERRRLVGAVLAEPLPLRMVGAARCSAVATGLRVGRGAERGGEVLLPPAPREAAVTVAGVVIDCPPAMRTPVREHGWRARRRRFTRAALGGAIVCAGCLGGWLAGGPLWPLVLGAAVLAAGIPLAQDRYRNLGHATVGGYLVSGSGSLVRRRAALRQDAVIGWNVRSSWFQRRAGLVTLTATTAAGRQGYAVRDIPTGTALALAAAVTPGLLDPFRTAPPATSR